MEVVSCSGSLVLSCTGRVGAAFPIYTAQAPGCSIWSMPCVACGSSFWIFHKSVDSVAPALCAFPSLSSSGIQELDRCTLPGCGAPSPLRGPSLSLHPCQSGACILCLATTIQNLRKYLVRNWSPGCIVVGDAVFGAKFAPFPSPLPPASGGAGPVGSWLALLWTCSDTLFCEQPAVCSGWLIFSLSFAIPQFKLVSHKSSLQLSLGHLP